MTSLRAVPMPGVNAVVAGATATVDLPPVDILHKLLFEYTTGTAGGANQANMEAELTKIRIKVNGVVQREFKAEELFDINAYRGVPFATGVLPIYLAQPWMRSPAGEDALAWGMQDVATLQVEIDIAGAAVNPTLKGWILKEVGNRPMGPIVKWKRFVVPVSAIGVVNVTQLPKTNNYYAMHAHSADITAVKVRVDQVDHWDIALAAADEIYKDHGFTPQTGWVHIDRSFRARVSEDMEMVRQDGRGAVSDLQVDFTMSAANSFDLLTETIGLRD